MTDSATITRLVHKGKFRPAVRFAECPIHATLGVLGRKWTTLILRDIGFKDINRFNRLLESIVGLTPRVLSMRLKELEEAGYIRRVEEQESPPVVRWGLTDKGIDILPVLMGLIAFGSKWHSRQVFDDGQPRVLSELFSPETLQIVEGLRLQERPQIP